MKTEDFRKLVDVYSSDLSRWPKDCVKPALALMRESAEAKRLFDETLELDEDLRKLGGANVDCAMLEERILRSVSDMRQAQGSLDSFAASFSFRAAYLFAPGGGLLAAAIIGFLVGFQPGDVAGDYVLDPVFYAEEQIIAGDAGLFEEEVF